MPEFELNRKEEIVNACIKLYTNYSFKDINIKLIGENTTFSRTSIYNYFQTKEEIFLEILKNEYELWNKDLETILNNNESLSNNSFSKLLSESVSKRINMLKLLSMNLYDIEENSRIELLTDFKIVFSKSMNLVRKCLKKFFIKISNNEIDDFIYSFFPFMYGIYPYTMVTNKQKEALSRANADYKYMNIYDITYKMLNKLLKFGGKENE